MHYKCKHIEGISEDYPETIRIVSGYYQLIGLLSERPIRPILRKPVVHAFSLPKFAKIHPFILPIT